MQLELYIAGASQANLSNWVAKVSAVAQAEGIAVIQSPVQEAVETLQEQLPLVLDDLCAIPDWRVEFRSTVEERLRPFAYQTYLSCLKGAWGVCLYLPSKEAVFLPFEEKLLARRVAHLYYQEGTSDKVYHLYLTQALTLDFYAVISRYGRRGGKLQHTEKVFDYRLDEAETEWNRLHHAKIQKGYQSGQPTHLKQLELELLF